MKWLLTLTSDIAWNIMFCLFETVQEAVGDGKCQLVLAMMHMMDLLNGAVTYMSLLALVGRTFGQSCYRTF